MCVCCRTSWQWCEAVKFVFVWVVLQVSWTHDGSMTTGLLTVCVCVCVCGCVCVCVVQVTQPFLSTHLPRVLPAALLLSDHHRPETSVLGVACLHHIVLNTVRHQIHYSVAMTMPSITSFVSVGLTKTQTRTR